MWLSFVCIGVAMLFSRIKPMEWHISTPTTDKDYSNPTVSK